MSRRALIAAIAAIAVALGAAAVALAAHSSQRSDPRPGDRTHRVDHHPRTGVTHRRAQTAQAANATPTVAGGLIVGLNANVSGWAGSSTGRRLDQVVSQTDTKWLREVFDWATIEPSPGHFDFSYYDHFMRLAAQRGERVLPVLYDTPAWAGAAPTAIPTDPSAFAGYVAAVVGRYGANGSFWRAHPSLAGSTIRTWELWNEPYSPVGE